MREDDGKGDGPGRAIAEKIDAACKEVVLVEEIEKLKQQATQQLSQAKDNLALAKQQVALWDTRIKQIVGHIAGYNTILEKKQKPKTLIFQDDHHRKERK